MTLQGVENVIDHRQTVITLEPGDELEQKTKRYQHIIWLVL